MKLKKWQLQEAKNKFSEVVRKATEEGPQTVTKHGKDSVVVISVEDYKKMERPETSLAAFFQQSPLASVALDLERDKSPARDISL
ncbi:prevent-host-death family protein [Fodinibius roseus]|uniref:Antitoxin n=1 Tax=Fodinibius roseus TaxID=1194090 RepID=A0A1M5GH42_9BACT|nr:type II toxin-antitoxin system Phd/YefM family antitoxin [Fodinibius roseus]SHG03044.1 prevent-host-death family protein [Fodinibius roseus]